MLIALVMFLFPSSFFPQIRMPVHVLAADARRSRLSLPCRHHGQLTDAIIVTIFTCHRLTSHRRPGQLSRAEQHHIAGQIS